MTADRAPGPRLPDSDALLHHLRGRLPPADADGVAIVARESNMTGSSHARDVVTLRWVDGRRQRVVIKYDAGDGASPCGLATGASYEASVYEQVLAPLAVTVPACFGAWRDEACGLTALAVEHLDEDRRHARPTYEEQMSTAAAWIGRLHALALDTIVRAPDLRLNTYNTGVYRCWAARTREFERRTQVGRSWLPTFIDRLDRVIDILERAPQTVIHGDYYPDNTVVHAGVVWVFDWEESALAPGEIDLASLTHDWHDEVVTAAEDAYRRARWPDGEPDGFAETLEAARIFVVLRLLGEARGWPNRSMRRHRVEMLRRSADRLGIL